ncbi:hypothetical protein AB9F42_06075 [Rhizobium leguminosarum]|uniref:hypothetical protein n=1 Tax=Rhizobium leguminosarum TaxID=384 RepID=UPI003F9B1350
MHITRRQFAALAAVVFLPGIPRAADEETALFWRAKSPANDHVLFGCVRIRADSFPDIVAEGKRLVDQSKTVLCSPDQVKIIQCGLCGMYRH